VHRRDDRIFLAGRAMSSSARFGAAALTHLCESFGTSSGAAITIATDPTMPRPFNPKMQQNRA
jgi:hypothetical protein